MNISNIKMIILSEISGLKKNKRIINPKNSKLSVMSDIIKSNFSILLIILLLYFINFKYIFNFK